METETAKKLSITKAKASYDHEAKLLMSDPPLLSYILKHTVRELRDMDESEIISRMGERKISKIPVEPGKTNLRGLDPDVSITGEGDTYFDILFTVVHLDKEDIGTYLYIDFEIQRNPHPGYNLIPRSVLYCGRMLSMQFGQEVTAESYGELKKVYSIWICLNCSKKEADTITSYHLTQEDLYGYYEDDSFDLLEIVMVRLPKQIAEKDTCHPLIRMAGTVLSDELDAETKKSIMEHEYGIPMSRNAERSLEKMCNLSEGILAKGMEQGMEKGVKKGREEGKNETRAENFLTMMRDGLGLVKSKKYSGVSDEKAEELIKKYNL